MAFDGCFHDNDIELTPFSRMAPTLTSDPLTTATLTPDIRPAEGTRLRRQRSVRENVDLLVSNSYMIDSYSRLAFPLSYLLFNTIYWSLYSWSRTAASPWTLVGFNTVQVLSQRASLRIPALHRAPRALHWLLIRGAPSAPASLVIMFFTTEIKALQFRRGGILNCAQFHPDICLMGLG